MGAYRVVVVGAGGISNAWFPNLKKEGFDIAGVVDLDRDAAKKKVKEHGLDCPVSTSLAGMLKPYVKVCR